MKVKTIIEWDDQTEILTFKPSFTHEKVRKHIIDNFDIEQSDEANFVIVAKSSKDEFVLDENKTLADQRITGFYQFIVKKNDAEFMNSKPKETPKISSQSSKEINNFIFQNNNFTLSLKSFISDSSLFKNWDDFSRKGQIGNGGFASIRLYVENITQTKYAFKIIHSFDPNSESLRNEIKIFSEVHHPCIHHLYGLMDSNNSNSFFAIITPYYKKGSLDQIINKENAAFTLDGWDETQKYIVMYGIAAGMYHLHKNEIAHLDLKPANVLLNNSYEPIITDFGLSKFVKEVSPESSEIKGTVLYMAPEIIEARPNVDPRLADIYAYGVLLYQLITGLTPFAAYKQKFQVLKKVLNGGRPAIPNGIDPNIKKLIEDCWNQNPDLRPSFENILLQLGNPDNIPSIDVDRFLNYQKQIIDEDRFILIKQEEIDDSKPIEHLPFASLPPGRKSLEHSVSEHVTKMPEEQTQPERKPIAFDFDLAALAKKAKEMQSKPSDATEPKIKLTKISSTGVMTRPTRSGTLTRMAKTLNDIRQKPKRLAIRKRIDIQIKEMADNGDHFSQYQYGCMLRDGTNGVTPNLEEAVRYFKMAYDNNDSDATIAYAICLKEGKGTDKNETLAKELIEQLALQDDPEAQFIFAQWLQEERKFGIAYEWLIKASENNHSEAPTKIGEMLEKGKLGTNAKMQEVVNWYKKSVEKGSLEGTYNMATMYHKGTHVVKDEKEAIRLYKIGAAEKHQPSIFSLSHIYQEMGDYQQAFDIAEFSAQNGIYPVAYIRLSELYADGIGCQPDSHKAEANLKMACSPEYSKSQLNIAFAYSKGRGAPVDCNKAFFWTEVAAKNGSKKAASNLAGYYMDGYACDVNYQLALDWATIAKERGDKRANRLLSHIYHKMGDVDNSIKYLIEAAEDSDDRSMVDLAQYYNKNQDYEKMIHWIQLAANLRNPQGCFLYGMQLLSGEHIPIDIQGAIQQFELAASMNYEKAFKPLIKVYKKGLGVPVDLEKAQKYKEDLGQLSKKKKSQNDRKEMIPIPQEAS